MARPNASRLGCFGTGHQAETQILAVARVRDLESIHVYGRDADRRKAFAEKMNERAIPEPLDDRLASLEERLSALEQLLVAPGAQRPADEPTIPRKPKEKRARRERGDVA